MAAQNKPRRCKFMENQEFKCVIVLDQALPAGVLANTASILGVTLGRQIPEIVGEDAADASGVVHKGIVKVPIPILRGDAQILKAPRAKLCSEEFCDLFVVDFSDVAQGCQVYEQYMKKASQTKEEEHTYLGIAICGDKKKVNRLTGSMPLLR